VVITGVEKYRALFVMGLVALRDTRELLLRVSSKTRPHETAARRQSSKWQSTT
jgi:hypothetical protein